MKQNEENGMSIFAHPDMATFNHQIQVIFLARPIGEFAPHGGLA